MSKKWPSTVAEGPLPANPERYCVMNLTATITEAPEKVTPLREEAGCFVLLTNLVDQQEDFSPGTTFPL
jgi:hypothetical protein